MVEIISDRGIKQVIGRPSLGPSKEDEKEPSHSVRKVMTQNAVTVRQDDDIREAIELMVENKFSGLPVVDHHQNLVGVISAIDVLGYSLDLLDRVEGKQGKKL